MSDASPNAARTESFPHFQVEEQYEGGRLRLTLVGELDLASSPSLEAVLIGLKAANRAVCLDLSQLEFIDSSGIRVLFRAIEDAHDSDWDFRIADGVPRPVMQVMKLVGLDRLIVEHAGGSNNQGR
jgi:anti-anti-sigma factor